MKTPITDAILSHTKGIPEYHAKLEDTARRLELDRAALMEALEEFIEEQCEARPTEYSSALGVARQAIAAARANFPES